FNKRRQYPGHNRRYVGNGHHPGGYHQIITEQMFHFDRLRALSFKSDYENYTVRDHEDIFYAITRHDSEMAQMLMSRHLNRHRLKKSELLERYPEYFVA
ncbi:MAG: FCD domain-containing protein, partial [Schaedlerella arabinosiphila]|nr:FCD domain-containing protein [Schaedlerella arabinosiphila]